MGIHNCNRNPRETNDQPQIFKMSDEHMWIFPLEENTVSYLGGKALAGTVIQQKLDNLQVVFLGGHIQGCETILRKKKSNVGDMQ